MALRLAAYAAVYLLGGVTLVPLLLVGLLCYSYITLPVSEKARGVLSDDKGTTTEDDETLKEKLQARNSEPDAAAGYFAVCREYVPGGLHGKPPERTTPAGEVVAPESPSVYQSMYRSIFERGKSQQPSLDANTTTKRGRNVFYVVLRHNHLMLFDNADQLEVRHVIALANYDIDIYGGGDKILEGELYIKRNCIRLTKRSTIGDITPTSLPFFLFSDNCSDKEDFYHSLIRTQESRPESSSNPPTSLMFDTEDMINLVRSLHASDENAQTRWFNALVGRIFLAMYKTPRVEDHIRMKITRKIARVSKPTFITSLRLDEVSMGTSAPVISNPKLREMNVDGGLTLEASLKYTGGIRLVVAAVARLDLGPRFKAREVDLVLAGVLKKLEGHILIRVKPPPSNRIWVSFEQMPKIELSIEPIVSSRQITYGVIIRAIESKVREVFLETLVYPNWDDFPFTQTQGQRYRGGIWKDDKAVQPMPDEKTSLAQRGLVDRFEEEDNESNGKAAPPVSASSNDKIASMPDLSRTLSRDKTVGRSSSFQIDGTESDKSTLSPRSRSPPKALRSQSFATIASPIISTDPADVKSRTKSFQKKQQDAASSMKILSSRSQESSPVGSPARSLTHDAATFRTRRSQSITGASGMTEERSDHEKDSEINIGTLTEEDSTLKEPELLSRTSTTATEASARSSSSAASILTPEKKAAIEQSITSATAAAKKWGLGVLHRRAGSTGKEVNQVEEFASSPKRFYGRGQPLPPPGVPLPAPEKGIFSAAKFGSINRKPVPVAPTTKRTSSADLGEASPAIESAQESEHADAPNAPPSVTSSTSDSVKDADQSWPSSVASEESSEDHQQRQTEESSDNNVHVTVEGSTSEVGEEPDPWEDTPDIAIDLATPTLEKKNTLSPPSGPPVEEGSKLVFEEQELPEPLVEPI